MTLNLVFLVKQKSVTWSKAIADASEETMLRTTEMHMRACTSVFSWALSIRNAVKCTTHILCSETSPTLFLS